MICNINNLPEITTDVLIVGGGSAGAWCACRIKELVPELSVTIVDKGPEDRNGAMAEYSGDMISMLPGDDINGWMEDFVYYWDGLCDQLLLEKILRKSYDILRDYADNGCEFIKDKDGIFCGVVQRGLRYPALRQARVKEGSGRRMTQIKFSQAQKRGVSFVRRTMLTDLVKCGERVVGAVGFSTVDGVPLLVHARAVVIATGNPGWKTSRYMATATGEGLTMSFRAGAEMRNFEFAAVRNVSVPISHGGLTADTDGRTNVPGLYAAGGCRGIENGMSMDGFSLLATAVSSYYAGEAVVTELKQGAAPQLRADKAQIKMRLDHAYRPLGAEGFAPEDVLNHIQDLIFPWDVCIRRSEKSLSAALERLRYIQAEEVPNMAARDPYCMRMLWEVDAIAETSRWYLLSSLERKESRAGHYRSDYPGRNDREYLAWITLWCDGFRSVKMGRTPVPLGDYKYKVNRYYSDDLMFAPKTEAGI